MLYNSVYNYLWRKAERRKGNQDLGHKLCKVHKATSSLNSFSGYKLHTVSNRSSRSFLDTTSSYLWGMLSLISRY